MSKSLESRVEALEAQMKAVKADVAALNERTIPADTDEQAGYILGAVMDETCKRIKQAREKAKEE